MGDSNSRLVYSSDPSKNGQQNQKCPKCKEIVAACKCVVEPDPRERPQSYKFVAVLRIEKQGRGGKTVTVIDRLPKQELFLKDLCTELKKKCGTGGTYILSGKDGVIEIRAITGRRYAPCSAQRECR